MIAIFQRPEPRVIEVKARKFTYEPSTLTLKLNEPVIFRLTTLDVVMGFSVPDFGVRATILPGQTTDLAMTPTKAGVPLWRVLRVGTRRHGRNAARGCLTDAPAFLAPTGRVSAHMVGGCRPRYGIARTACCRAPRRAPKLPVILSPATPRC